MLIKITLSEQENKMRRIDPDWVYIAPGTMEALKAAFSNSSFKGALLVTTTIDEPKQDFYTLWNQPPC